MHIPNVGILLGVTSMTVDTGAVAIAGPGVAFIADGAIAIEHCSCEPVVTFKGIAVFPNYKHRDRDFKIRWIDVNTVQASFTEEAHTRIDGFQRHANQIGPVSGGDLIWVSGHDGAGITPGTC